jgi:RNA polymerase sigma factor (sigma-70 family)
LVTGGARGIGAGVVRVLAQCGAAVAFTHLGSERGAQAARDLVSDLTGCGHSVLAFTAPADDAAAMARVVSEAADQMGGMDIVVPNVGQNWVAPIDVLELDAWRKGLDTNLTTAFIAVKLALPWLLKTGRADVVAAQTMSAGVPGDEDSPFGLAEMLADPKSKPPDEELFEQYEKDTLYRLLDAIDEREAKVLRMRYGLGGVEPRTLKEIGEILGLTRERVRQIENEALRKLNAQMLAEEPEER